MKYGFKARAERISLAEREAIGLTATCRLDPRDLAAAKSVPVVRIGELEGVPEGAVRRLHEDDPGAFSAAAVVRDHLTMIVVNEVHTPERQCNSLAHELAHLILGHEPAEMIGVFGSRTLSKGDEAEADWLAGCLLVPGSGLPSTVARCGGDLAAAAAHYGVSLELLRWRHNMTAPKPRRRAA